MDGADCNRQFIKMHFSERDPVEDQFVTTNVYTGTPMIFIMDPKVHSRLNYFSNCYETFFIGQIFLSLLKM